jgi:tetratricopeptide (TPR) repeat protein
MGEAGPEIARFVPKVRVAFPDLPPPVALPTDQARHYMFESVCDFFERSAAIQPMLMVLEDLHWADASTTQLLESVARRAERTALLVLGTYRDVDLGPRDPFMRGIEHLSRLAAVSRITLKRLSAGEVADILRALSGREPPERLVRLVYDETEGVPLFVEEVYRHLTEERRLTDAAGNWLPEAEIGEIEVPETVRLVLGRRIDRIGDTAQRIMTTAACIGRTFTFEFLAALAEESEDDLLDALDEAERVRLVVAERPREPRFVFAHEQIRQTFLSRLSFVRRQRLHGRVADTMERVYAGHLDERVSDLAYHLAQAGARERAATYLHQAGSSAAARLATPEALAFFARAAELAGPGPTRRAALRARGELLLGLFRGREAALDLELAMREAAAEGAAAEEMEALLRLGRAYYVVALDYGPAIEHFLPAVERARQLAVQLGDRRGEALALILTQRHAESFAPELRPQAAANTERALAIARELGDEDLEVDALRAASRSLSERRVGYRVDIEIEQIAVSLERRGDLIALNEHLFESMWTYWKLGRFADCVTCSDRATTLAGRLGIPPVQYATIKSFALADLGRFDEAWQALEQEVADDDHPFGRAFQLLGQTWWYLASGDVERVLRDVPRVFADARELRRAWMSRWAEDMLASAIVATHPDGTSAAALKAAVEAAGGRLTGDGLVAARLLAGNADAALAECERSLPQLDAEGRGRPYWTTAELRARALLALGRFAEVCDAVDATLAVVMPLGWQSLVWRLRASRAVALAGLGDKTAAAAERRAAVDILMTVAGTLRDPAARARFLSRPAAASLLA